MIVIIVFRLAFSSNNSNRSHSLLPRPGGTNTSPPFYLQISHIEIVLSPLFKKNHWDIRRVLLTNGWQIMNYCYSQVGRLFDFSCKKSIIHKNFAIIWSLLLLCVHPHVVELTCTSSMRLNCDTTVKALLSLPL